MRERKNKSTESHNWNNAGFILNVIQLNSNAIPYDRAGILVKSNLNEKILSIYK